MDKDNKIRKKTKLLNNNIQSTQKEKNKQARIKMPFKSRIDSTERDYDYNMDDNYSNVPFGYSADGDNY